MAADSLAGDSASDADGLNFASELPDVRRPVASDEDLLVRRRRVDRLERSAGIEQNERGEAIDAAERDDTVAQKRFRVEPMFDRTGLERALQENVDGPRVDGGVVGSNIVHDPVGGGVHSRASAGARVAESMQRGEFRLGRDFGWERFELWSQRRAGGGEGLKHRLWLAPHQGVPQFEIGGLSRTDHRGRRVHQPRKEQRIDRAFVSRFIRKLRKLLGGLSACMEQERPWRTSQCKLGFAKQALSPPGQAV